MPVTKYTSDKIYQWQISSDKMIVIKVFVWCITKCMWYIWCINSTVPVLGTLSVICVIHQCQCLETLQLIIFWRAPPHILKNILLLKKIDKIRTSFRNPPKFHEKKFPKSVINFGISNKLTFTLFYNFAIKSFCPLHFRPS